MILNLITCLILSFKANSYESQFINIGATKLVYNTYHKALSGRFFFTLNRFDQRGPSGHLVILKHNGTLLFKKSFNKFPVEFPIDFRPNEDINTYFYNYSSKKFDGHKDYETKILAIDEKFNDVSLDITKKLDYSILDNHEFIKTRRGYLFINYLKDLDSQLIFPQIIEKNFKGEDIFKWDSKKYLHLKDYPIANKDFLHMNSLYITNDQSIIISLSRVNQIMAINYLNGDVLWKVDQSWKFINDPFHGFANQHSAIFQNNYLAMYDNGTAERKVSRFVMYHLDFENKSATLVKEYRADKIYPFRECEGSIQILPNKNILIGWGDGAGGIISARQKLPLFTEITPEGNKVRELISLNGQTSYRVYFQPSP